MNELDNYGAGIWDKVFEVFSQSFRNMSEFVFAETPQLRMREDDYAYYIEGRMPHEQAERLNLVMDNGMLNISLMNETRTDSRAEGAGFISYETQVFNRSYSLYNVNEDEVRAQYGEGMLKIVMPKLNKYSIKRRLKLN